MEKLNLKRYGLPSAQSFDPVAFAKMKAESYNKTQGDFYEFDYYAGTGLTAFRQSGMSVQEKYLVRRETRTRAHRTAHK